MRRVVITGLGWSTSLGANTDSCWRNLVAGKSGIRTISHFDPSEYSVKVAAEVDHVPRPPVDGSDRRHLRRAHRLFLPVVQEAFADSRLGESGVPSERIGVGAATSVNYIDHRLIRRFFSLKNSGDASVGLESLLVNGGDKSVFFRRQGDTIVGLVSRTLNLHGPSFVMDTACAASSHAIGEAYRMVSRGKATAMIAGGCAALVCPVAMLAFALLGALSRCSDPAEASRPFDRKRDGFVMGEGAGAVVLESLESALARGARIYAELVGYGATLNAYSLTDPSPDGRSEARALSLALGEAGHQPEEVDYVVAHGTSTPKNDTVETKAIRHAFGAHASRLLVSSNKGQIGHTISAAGVCNLISAVKAINEGVVAPTINLREADPDCDLDYVPNKSRPAKVRLALANAFAFGGQNAVLAVRAWSGA